MDGWDDSNRDGLLEGSDVIWMESEGCFDIEGSFASVGALLGLEDIDGVSDSRTAGAGSVLGAVGTKVGLVPFVGSSVVGFVLEDGAC